MLRIGLFFCPCALFLFLMHAVAPSNRPSAANTVKCPPLRLIARLGHSKRIDRVAMSADGKWLATLCVDLTAKLWDLSAGKEVRTYVSVYSFALNADGKLLVTSNTDNKARLWEVASGQAVRIFSGHKQPISSLVLSTDAKWLVTGSLDGTIRLWEVATGKQIHQFQNKTKPIWSMAMSRDGK